MSLKCGVFGYESVECGVKKYDTIIIGGGAAGLCAAVFSARKGKTTAVIEKNKYVGRKLRITGKGRCNVTNNCDVRTVIANTPTNGKFLYSALTAFPPSEVMSFFEELGVPLKTERGQRVFPVSDKAADVAEALRRAALDAGAEIITAETKDIIISEGKAEGAVLANGDLLGCGRLIIATGGVSYPLTGSTGDGYRFAEKAGHTIVPARPSLVPVTTAEHFGYDAEGLLLKNISIKLIDTAKKRVIYTDFGECELHRYGLSGAVIRSASAHIRHAQPEDGRYVIELDLKPALDEGKLDARILRELNAANTGVLRDIMPTLLPRGIIEDVLAAAGLSGQEKCAALTKEQRRFLVSALKALKRTVTGFRPIDEAIVTSGGVSVREIDPKTMQSKLVSGLYFAGEVIDYDCYTGGFNLQCAFSTGRLASGCG